MPLPVISGVVRVAVIGTCPSGQRFTNVLHFKHLGAAPTPADIVALHGLITRIYSGTPTTTGGTNMLNNSSSSMKLTQVQYTPLDGSSTTTVLALVASGAAGGNNLPSEVTAVVTFRTDQRGRSYRGRAYLPVMTVSAVDSSGELTSGPLTSLPLQWQGAIALLGGISWEHHVASYLHGTSRIIISYTMDAKMDVQRRRK
jgi:hypothetical protein